MDARMWAGLSVLIWIVGWVAVTQFGGDLAAGALLSFVQAIWLAMVYGRVGDLEANQAEQMREERQSITARADLDRERDADMQLQLSETYLRGLLVPEGERQSKIAEMRRLIPHMKDARSRRNT